ncbi:hypothetical protein WQ54_17890, partial [Bacillus sp. SA1-12]|uniref:OmpL47-type beta-barrel domain-containing protein n=1 Tax=Bacillus sp. SA1-12 TaxID=1455638 RepID=UPI00062729C9
ISADVTDDEAGVSRVVVHYINPNAHPNAYLIEIPLNYNSTTRKYEGTYNVEKDNGEGEWKIDRIYLYDKKGNYDYQKLSNYNITIGSPPVTKIELQSSSPKVNEWYSSDVNVSLNATDDQSGVAKTLYKLNNGDWNQYTIAFELQNEGIHTIEYKSIDKAGNEEEVKSELVKIDKTAPTLNVSFDQSVITDRNHQLVPIKASVEADDNLSGVGSYELVSIVSNQKDNVKGDGNTTQDIQGAEFGTSDTNFLVRAERSGSEDRIYTVTYKATDNAGNTVTTSQDIVVKHDNSK